MLLIPDWPASINVRSYSTTRQGGVSLPPYHSFNLSTHVGDNRDHVEKNRQKLFLEADLPHMPIWLNQVHGHTVLNLEGRSRTQEVQADAVYTRLPGQVCSVMTADCLPVLLTSFASNEVAVVHAGWRGLGRGILEKTVAQFCAQPSTIMAWLGPAIGPKNFIVGEEVRTLFILKDKKSAFAFTALDDGRYLADIYCLARLCLRALGVDAIYGGNDCTVENPEKFFSYRASQGVTGRMVSLIWFG
ncbi:peptidoglycan editing factor PgeF [Candidatus Hamiltonella defensa]|uniref:peptidoglycan editing factor PgeF n=1 Tax=Candidatus Williamhamiltonella defendens TaxID=138072 RepID=UPI0015836CA8|nr:peptidoglycan editing factor PgeF [Candidatus Hamiltonella defensa]